VQFLDKLNHLLTVCGFALDHIIWHSLLAVFTDVASAAFEYGVLEVTVDHNDIDPLCQKIVGSVVLPTPPF
jgi:hypothetical protein